MTVIASIDGPNRRVYLHADTVNASWLPVELYREYRAARRSTESLRPYDALLRMEGNVPKGGGKATPRYMLMLGGTRIIPYDAAGVTTVDGEIITDDQASPFDYSTLTQPMIVNVAPADAEIVYVEIASPVQDRLDYADTLEVRAGSGYSGVIHPYGTSAQPVDNYADIRSLATEYGFNNVEHYGAISQLGVDLSNLHIEGRNPQRDSLTLNGGFTLGLSLHEIYLTGQANGEMLVRDSVVDGVTDFSGILHQVALFTGGLTVDASFAGVLQVLDCFSGVAGLGRPQFNMNGANCAISCRGYKGGLTVSGMTQGNAGSFDIDSGTIEFDASNTLGTAVVGGNYELIDNSGPGFSVIRRKTQTTEMHGRFDLDPDKPNTYADDGSTISNEDVTLTKVDNLDGTFDVVRS